MVLDVALIKEDCRAVSEPSMPWLSAIDVTKMVCLWWVFFHDKVLICYQIEAKGGCLSYKRTKFWSYQACMISLLSRWVLVCLFSLLMIVWCGVNKCDIQSTTNAVIASLSPPCDQHASIMSIYSVGVNRNLITTIKSLLAPRKVGCSKRPN